MASTYTKERPLRGIKMYSPMASAKTLLVGEVRMESFLEARQSVAALALS
ncbi:unnamed protein product [Symbiodinium sp. CCMP2592]|nr:unnamed protein product [Symbiodinium sp. CCMP2592]